MRIGMGRTAVGHLPRAATAGALLVGLLALASCTGTVPRSAAGTPSPTVAESAPSTVGGSGPSTVAPGGRPTSVPARVPDTLRFTGTTLTGAAFDAAALAGRPVVLWFWAPWCATCASQAWTVAEIAPKYRDTVPIVGVAGLGEQRAMKEFVTEFDLAGTPTIDDRSGVLWRRFEIVEQSTFLIIDRDGRVVHQGFLDGEALTARVAALAGA
ncbi:TlpA family protein disulfide reductase [Micromonospora sp. GCM10011542]|uniref:TlpA family protein disulfide reductase n=1 Tax=Micromonospora sp. GCM10011542 TaxID=3317337 RepID=UPI0036073A88